MPGSDIESFIDIERMDYVEQEGKPGSVAAEMDRRAIVISLGGSLFYREDGMSALATDFLGEAAEWLKGISGTYKVFVVVGGGRAAKDMIVELRGRGVGESALDSLGIDMTRVNARVLRCMMDLPGLSVPVDFDRALAESAYNKTVIMGGTHPGHTTDAVAAMLAEIVGATVLIIATDVDGIFNADPKEVPDARMFDELSPEDVIVLSADFAVGAGSKAPIDPMAARIIARSGIRTVVLNGSDLGNMEQAIRGSEFVGTSIEPEAESTLDGAEMSGSKREELEAKAGGKRKGKAAAKGKTADGKRLLLKSFSKKDGERRPKASKRQKREKPPEEETVEEEPVPGEETAPVEKPAPEEEAAPVEEPETAGHEKEEPEPEEESAPDPEEPADEPASEDEAAPDPNAGEALEEEGPAEETEADGVEWTTEGEAVSGDEAPEEDPGKEETNGDPAEWNLPSLDDVEV